MQGMLPDQTHFLVSGIPSRHYFSRAILEDLAGEESAPPQILLPAKATKALGLLLDDYAKKKDPAADPAAIRQQALADLLPGKKLYIDSNIPPGKGLGSSSTDILSVLALVNGYLGAGYSTEDLYSMAAAVEPTDPCLSDGILLFRQQAGKTGEQLFLPPLDIVYFDAWPGHTIDTLELPRRYSPSRCRDFAALLRDFLLAARDNDYAALFHCVTQSALYNQDILALPHFDLYRQFAAEQDAGLVLAHSGTILGFITPADRTSHLLPKVQRLAQLHGGALPRTETWDPHKLSYHCNE